MPHIHISLSGSMVFAILVLWPLQANANEPATEIAMEPPQAATSSNPVVNMHTNHDSVLELNRYTFRGNVVQPSDGRHNAAHWVVSFCPDWFEPCQHLAEPFANLGSEWQGKLNTALFTQEVRFARVDCAKEKVLCNEHNIEQYPTIHHYSKGKRIATWRGTQGDIQKRLTKWLGSQLQNVVVDSKERANITMDIKSFLKSYLTPGGHMTDIFLIFAVIALNIWLVCSNPELQKTLCANNSESGGNCVEPREVANSEESVGITRFLPDQWQRDRCTLVL